LQVLDLLGVGAGRLPRVLRSVPGAPGGHQHQTADADDGQQAAGGRQRPGHAPDASPAGLRAPRALVRANDPLVTGAHGTTTAILALSTPGTMNAYGCSAAQLGVAIENVNSWLPPSSVSCVHSW